MYGDIIPSNVQYDETKRFSDGGVFSDTQLHYGEVQEVIYPQDERSRSKQFIEYSVYVQYRDPITKAGVGRMYNNCTPVNMFGGVADKIQYTLRGAKSITDAKNNRLGLGSKVILLCINGETAFPVILGGIGDPQDKTQAKFDKNNNPGQYIEFAFNGIHFHINDNGELVVQYSGPTKIDGTLDTDKVKKADTGTRLAFLKDGSWSISSDDGNGNVDQQIAIDNVNKKITVTQNKALEIGQATDHFILGDTYRNAENQMHTSVQTGITNAVTKLQAAAAQLSSAIAPASPGLPIVAVNAAGPLIIAACAELTKAAQAIAQFESNAKQYLSQKNKTD